MAHNEIRSEPTWSSKDILGSLPLTAYSARDEKKLRVCHAPSHSSLSSYFGHPCTERRKWDPYIFCGQVSTSATNDTKAGYTLHQFRRYESATVQGQATDIRLPSI